MEKLNFYTENHKKIAQDLNARTDNVISPTNAFFILINGLAKEDLSNLCKKIQEIYPELSLDECYNLTQNIHLTEEIQSTIFNLAITCIKEGNHLGAKTINEGKINTSSWISHSIYSSEVCKKLATLLNLNKEKATTLGLLHDYGRKYNHSLSHVIEGFQALVDLGLYNEAIGCLTHSFVNGGRCSNNEPALEGFYLDEEGNPKWNNDYPKDDIALFLDNYKYDKYDTLLNVADLMATDRGIVSPYERIKDIATRRTIDPINRAYFLADITNVFIDLLNETNSNTNKFSKIKATNNITLQEVEEYFNIVSTYFFLFFLN